MKLNLQNAELRAVAGIPSQFLQTSLPQIAFSGRSNVGKSSLINTLLGRKSLARTSGQPGKTITVNYYEIDRKLIFTDLPGYGFAKRSPQERERLGRLGDGYFATQKPRAVLQLIDMKAGPTKDDVLMIDFLQQNCIPFIIVATKCDKLNRTERNAFCEKHRLPPDAVIPFSSLTGEGKDDVWACIMDACDASDPA